MAKFGDKVRFLNAVGGGVISRIEGNMAYVTDEDGFDNPVFLRECVVVEEKKKVNRIGNADDLKNLNDLGLPIIK